MPGATGSFLLLVAMHLAIQILHGHAELLQIATQCILAAIRRTRRSVRPDVGQNPANQTSSYQRNWHV